MLEHISARLLALFENYALDVRINVERWRPKKADQSLIALTGVEAAETESTIGIPAESAFVRFRRKRDRSPEEHVDRAEVVYRGTRGYENGPNRLRRRNHHKIVLAIRTAVQVECPLTRLAPRYSQPENHEPSFELATNHLFSATGRSACSYKQRRKL